MRFIFFILLLLPFSGSSTGAFEASVKQLEDQVVWIEQWDNLFDTRGVVNIVKDTKQNEHWEQKGSMSNTQLLTISSYEGL